jgi:hypothetical protein
MKDATSISVTGGTGAAFQDDGQTVTNGIHVVDTSITVAKERPHATFKNRGSSLQKDGTYSKGKRDITYTKPKSLADGSTSFQVGRIGFEIHPELSVQEITDFRYELAQMIIDAELDDFFVYGSVK